MSKSLELRQLMEKVQSGEMSVDEAMLKAENTRNPVGRPKNSLSQHALTRNIHILIYWLILSKERVKKRGDKGKIKRFLSEHFNVEESAVKEILADWNKIIAADEFIKKANCRIYCSEEIDLIWLIFTLPQVVEAIKSGDIEKKYDSKGCYHEINAEKIIKFKELKGLKNSRNIIPMMDDLFD